jgi:hypothetical protein
MPVTFLIVRVWLLLYLVVVDKIRAKKICPTTTSRHGADLLSCLPADAPIGKFIQVHPILPAAVDPDDADAMASL